MFCCKPLLPQQRPLWSLQWPPPLFQEKNRQETTKSTVLCIFRVLIHHNCASLIAENFDSLQMGSGADVNDWPLSTSSFNNIAFGSKG